MAKKTVVGRLDRLDLPPEIFDITGGVIYKRHRISVARINTMRFGNPSAEEVNKILAFAFPKWEGVIDCETGEPLGNPEDDPAVFDRLANEQHFWLGETLAGVTRGPNGRGRS